MARAPVTLSVVEIRNERVRAGIDPVGAGVQALEVDGVAVVDTYSEHGADGGAPMASGATMFPWPNRVRDGVWNWNGEVLHLAITDPSTRTANHGLVRTRTFHVTDRTAQSVTLSTVLDGEPGYPFCVRLDVRYCVLADGLRVSYRVTNEGNGPAPVAVGAHPYLRVGTTDTSDLILQLPATTVMDVDDRLLPVTLRSVVGTSEDPHDLAVGLSELNHCFGGLVTGASGDAACRVVAPDGSAVEFHTDGRFRWMQVYTTPEFVRGGEPTRAIAIEPMTAPPDALNSQEDLVWVEPRSSWDAWWTMRRVVSTARGDSF
jgi:aldose 1-epimerase